jgi:predicted ArsR family transcriptional regulator
MSSLDDPVRHRLYDFVCGRSAPVGRNEAASAAGISRALAVYHLDKLAQAGLLITSYQRPAGRSGPGAGRPAKLYTRSGRDFAVTLPPREYELAARVLVRAVEVGRGGPGIENLSDVARRLGAELTDPGVAPAAGKPARQDLAAVLSEHGYEPVRSEDGTIWLRNCPFHGLAQRHRDVVCRMNLGLVSGIIAGLRMAGACPVLDPRPGHCCVVIATRRAAMPPLTSQAGGQTRPATEDAAAEQATEDHRRSTAQ